MFHDTAGKAGMDERILVVQKVVPPALRDAGLVRERAHAGEGEVIRVRVVANAPQRETSLDGSNTWRLHTGRSPYMGSTLGPETRIGEQRSRRTPGPCCTARQSAELEWMKRVFPDVKVADSPSRLSFRDPVPVRRPNPDCSARLRPASDPSFGSVPPRPAG
jgi:hypothetical protein